jgi:hypothetical protein
VAGHGELRSSTLCPGERLAARLAEVRARAAALIGYADAERPPARGVRRRFAGAGRSRQPGRARRM